MPRTKSRGKASKRRTPARRTTRGTRAPRWDAVDLALRRAGLLTALPVRGPDATDDIPPIVIPGEPVSETITRERR